VTGTPLGALAAVRDSLGALNQLKPTAP
jgi:hypothetical protein